MRHAKVRLYPPNMGPTAEGRPLRGIKDGQGTIVEVLGRTLPFPRPSQRVETFRHYQRTGTFPGYVGRSEGQCWVWVGDPRFKWWKWGVGVRWRGIKMF